MKKGLELSKKEVSELLEVHRNTVTNLLESGKLKGTNVRDLLEYVRKLEGGKAVSRIIDRLKEVADGEV